MTNKRKSPPAKKTRALFLGRHNCDFSKKACEHLAHLGFAVETVFSKSRGEPMPGEIASWSGDYIFCFRSYFVLAKSYIDRAAIAAINFHPAPVEYPGSGCLNWALYDESPTYGATAHLMNEKIDNGAIIECRRFPILPQDNVTTLLARTHHKTFDLIIDITTGLALEGKRFLDRKLSESKNEKWRGAARKMSEIDRLQIIDPSVRKKNWIKLSGPLIRHRFRQKFASMGTRSNCGWNLKELRVALASDRRDGAPKNFPAGGTALAACRHSIFPGFRGVFN